MTSFLHGWMQENEDKMPNMLLVGVESEVPDELRPYFIHYQVDIIWKNVTELKDMLKAMSKRPSCMFKMSDGERSRLLNKMSITFQHMVRLGHPKSSKVLKATRRIATSNSSALGNTSNQEAIRAMKDDLLLLLNTFDQFIYSIQNLPKDSIEHTLLNQAQMVFCTLCIAGRYSMRHLEPFDVLVVDEAAQPIESE